MTPEDDILKRDEKKALKDLKIITAISLGKDRNKEIAHILDTDKSFAAKKVRDLEERGLVYREGSGKETRYKINSPSVFDFLQSKVVIKWREKVPAESSNNSLSQKNKEVLEWLKKKEDLEK